LTTEEDGRLFAASKIETELKCKQTAINQRYQKQLDEWDRKRKSDLYSQLSELKAESLYAQVDGWKQQLEAEKKQRQADVDYYFVNLHPDAKKMLPRWNRSSPWERRIFLYALLLMQLKN